MNTRPVRPDSPTAKKRAAVAAILGDMYSDDETEEEDSAFGEVDELGADWYEPPEDDHDRSRQQDGSEPEDEAGRDGESESEPGPHDDPDYEPDTSRVQTRSYKYRKPAHRPPIEQFLIEWRAKTYETLYSTFPITRQGFMGNQVIKNLTIRLIVTPNELLAHWPLGRLFAEELIDGIVAIDAESQERSRKETEAQQVETDKLKALAKRNKEEATARQKMLKGAQSQGAATSKHHPVTPIRPPTAADFLFPLPGSSSAASSSQKPYFISRSATFALGVGDERDSPMSVIQRTPKRSRITGAENSHPATPSHIRSSDSLLRSPSSRRSLSRSPSKDSGSVRGMSNPLIPRVQDSSSYRL